MSSFALLLNMVGQISSENSKVLAILLIMLTTLRKSSSNLRKHLVGLRTCSVFLSLCSTRFETDFECWSASLMLFPANVNSLQSAFIDNFELKLHFSTFESQESYTAASLANQNLVIRQVSRLTQSSMSLNILVIAMSKSSAAR